MKRVITTVLLCTVFAMVLTSCGMFSSPDLGTAWNTKGAASITLAQAPLAVQNYSLTVNVEFGDMWDANKVKGGTVTFGAVSSDQRVSVSDPKYNVISGSYDKGTTMLELVCEETTNKSKITLRGKVANKTTISAGTITGTGGQLGTFNVEKQ